MRTTLAKINKKVITLIIIVVGVFFASINLFSIVHYYNELKKPHPRLPGRSSPHAQVDTPSAKSIHVFVALCDNINQNIVKVPAKLGNGSDPANNLYWGALYGVKAFFKGSDDWKLVSTATSVAGPVLERCIFRYRETDFFLIADAYKGAEIKKCTVDFLRAAAGIDREAVTVKAGSSTFTVYAKGAAGLVAYCGHNWLMDFSLSDYPAGSFSRRRDAIILACKSKEYFAQPLRRTGAYPLLWTTSLMAPEAYTLKSAVEGWLEAEPPGKIVNRAIEAYAKYQKINFSGAQTVFATGW